MDKVYALTWSDYEGGGVLAIHSSFQGAAENFKTRADEFVLNTIHGRFESMIYGEFTLQNEYPKIEYQKPRYDHSQNENPAYRKQHEALVHAWRNDYEKPYHDALSEYQKQKYEYLEKNHHRYIEFRNDISLKEEIEIYANFLNCYNNHYDIEEMEVLS